jgi:hypothetical protein
MVTNVPAQLGFDPSAVVLFDLITSQRITALTYVVARLGVADLIAKGAKTSGEIAKRTGAHEPSLRRLLRALVTIGVCRQVGNGEFELTALGSTLAGAAGGSLKAWALFEGEAVLRSWTGLLDSIRTGKPAAEMAGLRSGFELIAHNPRLMKMFNEAMAAFTRMVMPAVLCAYDFSNVGRLIDVGGGHGQLLCAILNAYTHLRGVVFDLPDCAEGARQQLAAAGVGDRGEFISGSFFEPVPEGADALILKNILHDWDDDRSLKILENCSRALDKRARLILVERLMPELPEANAEHRSIVLSDLNMLLGTGGCERTEREYRELLGKTGFRMTRILPAGPLNVLEAVRI